MGYLSKKLVRHRNDDDDSNPVTQAVVVQNELEETARLQISPGKSEPRLGAKADRNVPKLAREVRGAEFGEQDGDLFGEAREDEADGQGDEIPEGEVEDMAPKSCT